jgi:hypothetical protein
MKSEKIFDKIFPERLSEDQYANALLPAIPSRSNFNKTIKTIKDFYPKYNIENLYSFNSSGSRCEEFKSSHDGLHVLFAGCSVTSGEGLFLEDSWSYRLYKEISKNNKTSGYFNVAFPGASYTDILNQIFKYIRLYGSPDLIFINFPDIHREYIYTSTQNMLDAPTKMKDPKKFLNTNRINLIIYEYYSSLVQFCKTNNIKMYAFSWDPLPLGKNLFYSFDPREHFKNFYTFKEKDLYAHCYNFEKNNPGPFLIKGFDDEHQGIAKHDFYFNFMYDIFLKKYNLELSQE